MPLLKLKYHTELTAQKRTALLKKIRLLATEQSSRLVIERNSHRYQGSALNSFTIDETVTTGTLVFDAGPQAGVGPLAALVLQDLTYTAVAPGTDGEDVTVQYLAHTPAVAATAALDLTNDITLTSAATGTARNTTTFTLQVLPAAANPTSTILAAFTGTASAIVCTITPNDGTNNTATPVNLTTAQLRELITTGSVVGKTVTVTDGSSLRALQTATGGGAANLADGGEGDGVVATFSGGTAAVGLAGAEVVTVVGTAIAVRLQSGVSTATQVRAALLASAAAVALATVTISGTGSNAQTAPVSVTPLAGADDTQTFDAADIIEIRRLRHRKYKIVLAADADPA